MGGPPGASISPVTPASSLVPNAVAAAITLELWSVWGPRQYQEIYLCLLRNILDAITNKARNCVVSPGTTITALDVALIMLWN